MGFFSPSKSPRPTAALFPLDFFFPIPIFSPISNEWGRWIQRESELKRLLVCQFLVRLFLLVCQFLVLLFRILFSLLQSPMEFQWKQEALPARRQIVLLMALPQFALQFAKRLKFALFVYLSANVLLAMSF